MRGVQPPFDADGSLGIPPQVREHVVCVPAGDADQVAACPRRRRRYCGGDYRAVGGFVGKSALSTGVFARFANDDQRARGEC